jgi:hypothetical protein
MIRRLKKDLKKELSITDVYLLGGKVCNMLLYPEINEFTNIDQLFEINDTTRIVIDGLPLQVDNNSVVINYVSIIENPKLGLMGGINGHWCLLNRIKDKNGKYHYYFMDSYGMMPDKALSYLDNDFRYESNQLNTKLLDLILKSIGSGDKFNFNDIQMQVESDEIGTCGRYCGLYLRNNDKPVEDFVDNIMKLADGYGLTPDIIVTLLANDIMDQDYKV